MNQTNTVLYHPFFSTVRKMLRDLSIVFIVIVLTLGNVYFYNENVQKDILIAKQEVTLQWAQQENMRLAHERDEALGKLEKAMVPEATLGEFGKNRIITPIGNAWKWVKGLFSNDQVARSE